MSTARFDDADLLNEDGTVTFRMTPSNWRRYNISPDTYQSFNGDSWVTQEIEYLSEGAGRELSYDDITWTYDHSGIVRDLSQELSNWLHETLWDLGLESVSVELVDTWSPKFYNFQSDGFEVEVTCDPAELRALTEDFDVDAWGSEWYRSMDGFMSFVTSRLNDDDWRAGYDAEFRIESLLAAADTYEDRGWFYRLAECEWEVYSSNVVTEIIEPEYLDSGYTLSELEEWAREIAPTQDEVLIEV